MRFMNEYEIEEACRRWEDHPVLGPASLTVRNLAACADRNSDGWAHWPKPSRAAAKLMELIAGDGTSAYRFGDREDATEEKLRAAYRPIKSFLTRNAPVLTSGDLTAIIVEPARVL